MARTVTISSRVYQPQTVERTVDSFPTDVSKIRVRMRRENWPGTPEDDVVQVTILWNDGSGARYRLPGGVVNGKDKQPLLHSTMEIDVPQVRDTSSESPLASKKVPVVGGTITVEFRQAVRTAITIEAI